MIKVVEPYEFKKLISIKPAGVGSSEVEDLFCFLARLANAQGYRLGKFLTTEFNQIFRNVSQFRGRSGALLGVGSSPKDLLVAVDKTTGTKLPDILTMVPWTGVFPNKYLIRSKRAWCSLCYQSDKNQGHLVYDRLMWSLQAVECCLIHSMPLEGRCPFCGKGSGIYDERYSPGICSHCNRWLVKRKVEKTVVEPEKMLRTRYIAELLSLPGSPDFYVPNVSKVLTSFLNEVYSGNIAALSRETGVPKTTAWGWIRGMNLPPLPSLLDVCCKSGVTLKELLYEHL